MSLPEDVYIPVQAEADAVTYGYLNLGGVDCMVYLTSDGELRIKNILTSLIFTVTSGVVWCFPMAVDLGDQLGYRVYYYKPGEFGIYYFSHLQDYTNPPFVVTTVTDLPASLISFSMCYRRSDNLWVMLTDDGLYHRLFTANDPLFVSNYKSRVIYNLTLDPATQVHRPSIGVHDTPSAGDVLTVAVEFTSLSTGFSGVATYVDHLFKNENQP